MARRKKEKKIYKYDCSITGETFKLTEKAEHPEELLSVRAWYEMHSDQDDRPEAVIKRLGPLNTEESASDESTKE